MPSFKEMLMGKKAKTKKLSTLTPEQTELMTLIKEGLTKGTGDFKDIFGAFDEKAFEKGVTQPALKNFQENILPMLNEKFIASGAVGGSGMQRAQGQAASTLQSELAKLMYGAQENQRQNRITGVNTSIGRQAVENLHIPGTEGIIQGGAKAFAQGAGQAAGTAATGGAGAGSAGMPAYSGPAGGGAPVSGGVSAQGYDQQFRTNPAAMGYR